MRPISLPEVAYGATAVRPDWGDLPLPLRAAIEARLGARVTASTTAGGGFTRAFAAVVETSAGERAFLKAAPLTHPDADAYAREAVVTSALPPGIRAPRPRWTLATEGHYVLCMEALDGRVPDLPWKPDDLAAALRAWHTAAAALSRPTSPGLPHLSDLVRGELSWWSEIAGGRAPLPPAPRWVRERLDDLAGLEHGLPALVTGPGMLHGDLRIDNIMIDAYGEAWLCDWTWPCLGAPWFDTVSLLVTAYASGLDADGLLAPWAAPAAGVDGALAALSGHWLTRAAGRPSTASPHSRQHQRFSGEQALAWLAARRNWHPRN
ncbi:phosphotransferase family protein [Couchioplanes caeruleus]|uniref:Aminoglycoside phosphotransferase n=2 Tax=Couchioplanes caeruleus TaxID=56438 RepID=A0A1K0GFD3_9ACTN|nr:phosphotransferase [Couchioplanes caeruleus]OJF09548.1 aminoglycoside phosphotransferase [Couchioplanes caeruleus subsp. caeruleus]ROP29615.1 phosphotransferase family enzyme [Couchioplanes caeruleus]